MVPLTLNSGTRLSSGVNFVIRPLYPKGKKNPLTVDGPQTGLAYFGKEEQLLLLV
jgi:hypothetical protein